MVLKLLIKSIAIGFAIAAPVGPIGVLCIRRTLAEGPWMGLATGLGAATADVVFGFVAAFGLTAVAGFFLKQQFWFGLIGGGYLCYLGLALFKSPPPSLSGALNNGNWSRAYLSTFLLTLANPVTILSFIALFAGFGVEVARDYRGATVLVFGVLIGSALWWLMLSVGATLARARLSHSSLRLVNRLSGCFLFGFGLYVLLHVLPLRP
jgi:threonine/homoserine/homoserine lactone efflux protein